jgi:hypothetical protein
MTLDGLAIKAFLILAAITCAGVTTVTAKNWSGVYTHTEESFEPDGSRLSYWFRLEVTDEGEGKLSAVLSNGINGRETRRFQLNIAAGPTRAQFSYDHCLPLVADKSESCSEEFEPGDKLFALEEVPRHCQYELITEWQKLNLAQQTESGNPESRSDFFRTFLE